MCLKYFMNSEDKKKLIDNIGRSGLKVYKIVRVMGSGGVYSPPYRTGHYKMGVNIAPYQDILIGDVLNKYKAGFHCFKTKAAAKRLSNALKRSGVTTKVVQCIVKKSWITEIGKEWGYQDGTITFARDEVVIVAKKIIFPKE